MSNLPKGWKETKLDEIVDITSSKRIFYSEYVDFGIAFYRSKEIIEKQKGNSISTELFITKEKYNEIKNNFGVPVKDDLLLTSVGTLGIPYLVKENEIFYFKDGNLTWFRNYKGLEPKFLYFYILSPVGKKRLNEMAIGSTQSALTISGLKKLKLELPPLGEQKEIVNILSSFDNKIELLKEQNQTLETMAQTIFKEWFVDFNYPNATGEMYDSEMGEIPKGWRVGKLKDEFKIIMGQSPKGSSYNILGDGEVFYQGRAEFQDRFPKRRLYTTEPKRMANMFDVLMSVRAPVGDINLADEKCCIGRGLASICSDYKSYTLYKIKSLKKIFDTFELEGSVFGSINKTSLENIKVIIPEQICINKFELVINPIDNKLYNNSEQIKTLEETRDSLLPKLMSGKTRVEGFKVD